MNELDNVILTATQAKNTPLNMGDIKKAVEMLKEMNKKPFLVCIKSRHDWYKTIEKSPVTYGFAISGTPIYQDDSIPEGIIRFEMSDGTFTDSPYISKLI